MRSRPPVCSLSLALRGLPRQAQSSVERQQRLPLKTEDIFHEHTKFEIIESIWYDGHILFIVAKQAFGLLQKNYTVQIAHKSLTGIEKKE